jgi:hypothetical protein
VSAHPSSRCHTPVPRTASWSGARVAWRQFDHRPGQRYCRVMGLHPVVLGCIVRSDGSFARDPSRATRRETGTQARDPTCEDRRPPVTSEPRYRSTNVSEPGASRLVRSWRRWPHSAQGCGGTSHEDDFRRHTLRSS